MPWSKPFIFSRGFNEDPLRLFCNPPPVCVSIAKMTAVVREQSDICINCFRSTETVAFSTGFFFETCYSQEICNLSTANVVSSNYLGSRNLRLGRGKIRADNVPVTGRKSKMEESVVVECSVRQHRLIAAQYVIVCPWKRRSNKWTGGEQTAFLSTVNSDFLMTQTNRHITKQPYWIVNSGLLKLLWLSKPKFWIQGVFPMRESAVNWDNLTFEI